MRKFVYLILLVATASDVAVQTMTACDDVVVTSVNCGKVVQVSLPVASSHNVAVCK